MKLEFRAKMPNGKYFYQKRQHLPSFLRRTLTLYEVGHPKYLKKDLEEYLEIKIDKKWLQCHFNKNTNDKEEKDEYKL